MGMGYGGVKKRKTVMKRLKATGRKVRRIAGRSVDGYSYGGKGVPQPNRKETKLMNAMKRSGARIADSKLSPKMSIVTRNRGLHKK